jgi:hypothetical protein
MLTMMRDRRKMRKTYAQCMIDTIATYCNTGFLTMVCKRFQHFLFVSLVNLESSHIMIFKACCMGYCTRTTRRRFQIDISGI